MKKPKAPRAQAPKTEEQKYLDDRKNRKRLKGMFLVTPAVNYLGRGSYVYSTKVDWDGVEEKVKKQKEKK